MKTTVFLFILLFSAVVNAQDLLTEEQIRAKADSILIEGNLLYKYEKSAWSATDLAMKKKNFKKEYGGYLVYQKDDTIKTIILNKDNHCIHEFSFTNNYDKPSSEVTTKRNLTATENKLISIRNGIINDIANKKHEVVCPDSYNLNTVLIPSSSGYKLYILTGTSQSKIIPFGNDYLFFADEAGSVTSWKKFHSRLIPTSTKGPNGEEVKGSMHSHLKTEPFISATDICTFMLYGSLYGQNEFTVYSPALSKSFKYKLADNRIEIKDGL